GLAVAAAPFLMASPFYVHLAILTCLNVVIVSGLSLIARTGQLSFGHGAFVGLGAYGAVVTGMHLGWQFWLAALTGATIACLCALVLGWVILRLRGFYFVLVIFAFAVLVRLVMRDWPGITGGANGITGIPAAELIGFAYDTRHRFYGLALFCAIAALAFGLRVSRVPAGHAFDAVEQNA